MSMHDKCAGVHPEIANAKHEHWSSLAPLPLEVVLSAGQKAREEPSPHVPTGAPSEGRSFFGRLDIFGPHFLFLF
jgi:hypothetical protein